MNLDVYKRQTLVDTLSVDTVAPKKKQPLDAPVVYEANDSIVFTEGGPHFFEAIKPLGAEVEYAG